MTPQNVIVTYDGGVKLLDFGIAKASNRVGETRFGTLKGKVAVHEPGAVPRRAARSAHRHLLARHHALRADPRASGSTRARATSRSSSRSSRARSTPPREIDPELRPGARADRDARAREGAGAALPDGARAAEALEAFARERGALRVADGPQEVHGATCSGTRSRRGARRRRRQVAGRGRRLV